MVRKKRNRIDLIELLDKAAETVAKRNGLRTAAEYWQAIIEHEMNEAIGPSWDKSVMEMRRGLKEFRFGKPAQQVTIDPEKNKININVIITRK